MPTITYVNLTGFQRGVELDEAAMNIESIEITVKPEFIDGLVGKDGHVRGEGRGAAESEITLKGEISGLTGVMAATFYAEATVANDVDYFGATGDVYFNEATVTQEREGWKSVSIKGQRKPGIVSV